jgi:hypothetical protein
LTFYLDGTLQRVAEHGALDLGDRLVPAHDAIHAAGQAKGWEKLIVGWGEYMVLGIHKGVPYTLFRHTFS